MSLARAEEEVDLPEGYDRKQVERAIRSVLDDIDEIHLETNTLGEPHQIAAKSEPGFRSWGLEISARIEGNRVIIEGSSPEQSIDWGKSRSTVKDIAGRLRERLSAGQ